MALQKIIHAYTTVTNNSRDCPSAKESGGPAYMCTQCDPSRIPYEGNGRLAPWHHWFMLETIGRLTVHRLHRFQWWHSVYRNRGQNGWNRRPLHPKCEAISFGKRETHQVCSTHKVVIFSALVQFSPEIWRISQICQREHSGAFKFDRMPSGASTAVIDPLVKILLTTLRHATSFNFFSCWFCGPDPAHSSIRGRTLELLTFTTKAQPRRNNARDTSAQVTPGDSGEVLPRKSEGSILAKLHITIYFFLSYFCAKIFKILFTNSHGYNRALSNIDPFDPFLDRYVISGRPPEILRSHNTSNLNKIYWAL